METGEITLYRRYVDDIIIISNQSKFNEVSITKYMNNMHKYLEFKQTEEENKNINYLDLSIRRNKTTTCKQEFTENPHRHYYAFHIQPSIRT